MIAPDRIAAVVLAAGAATRFGGDKLLHPLDGKPLAAHIADTLAGIPFAHRIAIVPAGNDARAEIFADRSFDIVINPDPGQGLASSLALGAGMAAALGAEAVLVCLADMPFVTREHLEAADRRAGISPRPPRTPVSGRPPAIFPSSMFADLMSLTGDRGAKPLLEAATSRHAAWSATSIRRRSRLTAVGSSREHRER